MCTISYIPMEEGRYILTHNRDESIKRKLSSPPVKRVIDGKKHLFPVDPVGMGTWIGVSETGRTAALLNGGEKDYEHQPPYRHSRGLVILEYFQYPDFNSFFDNYDFSGLEPFTLLTIEEGEVFETIVDEEGPRVQVLDANEPFIYSSTSLYTSRSRRNRSKAFSDWYKRTASKDQEAILEFHQQYLFELEKDKSKVVGDHILKTVSITSALFGDKKLDFTYFDLVNDICFRNEFEVVEASNPITVPLGV